MNRKILVIGPSGSGKTYISSKLRAKGINTLDADQIEGLSGWFDGNGNRVEYQENADREFLDNHEFLWDKKFLKQYLEDQGEIYLFGLSGNIFEMLDLFDKVFFLSVEQDILAKNLRHESRENPMGKTDYQLENALQYAKEIEIKSKELGIKVIEVLDNSPEQILDLLN